METNLLRDDYVYILTRLQMDQYSETNVMHFLFNLLRIKGLYMFPVLLTHPQEALHQLNPVYCVCVMSAVCTRIRVPLNVSSITCSSSGSAQTVLGILRAYYVSWLHQDWSGTPMLVQPTDITRTQYTKCSLFSAS
jgi:hypothetical protein